MTSGTTGWLQRPKKQQNIPQLCDWCCCFFSVEIRGTIKSVSSKNNIITNKLIKLKFFFLIYFCSPLIALYRFISLSFCVPFYHFKIISTFSIFRIFSSSVLPWFSDGGQRSNLLSHLIECFY